MPKKEDRPQRRSRPESRIVKKLAPVERSPRQVKTHFESLLDSGARLQVAGGARKHPEQIVDAYPPVHELRLFEATYYLTGQLFDDALGFLVGYVVLDEASGKRVRTIFPRVFYKDSSLMWRVASHFVHDEDEYWIGKGDTRTEHADGEEYLVSVEHTTDLPFELQFAFDEVSRRRKRKRDDHAIERIVREAPSGRVEPYADFISPRRAAAARFAIHGDRPIARFRKEGDPHSLVFAAGFDPDFKNGLLEQNATESKFFGGELRKFRILSKNRQVQHLFFASPTHCWLTHPQALSTSLTSYGVRDIDVQAHDDLSIPGFEYHEEDRSQIPEGYAGEPHPLDPHRSDASAWLNELPVLREFRASLLRR